MTKIGIVKTEDTFPVVLDNRVLILVKELLPKLFGLDYEEFSTLYAGSFRTIEAPYRTRSRSNVDEGELQILSVLDKTVPALQKCMIKFYDEWPYVCFIATMVFPYVVQLLHPDFYDIYRVCGCYGNSDAGHLWNILHSRRSGVNYILDATYIQFFAKTAKQLRRDIKKDLLDYPRMVIPEHDKDYTLWHGYITERFHFHG